MRSGCSTGSCCSAMPLIIVNTVVLTPIPSASAITPATENHRSLTDSRMAKSTSCAIESSAGRPRCSR